MTKKLKELIGVWRGLGSGLKASYLKSLLFWNPLFSLGFSLWFGYGDRFFASWGTSFFISTMVSNFCFGTVASVLRLEAVYARLRNRAVTKHGIGWAFSLSISAMPAGLYLALSVTGLIYHALGMPWKVETGDYKTSILIGTLIAGSFFLLKTRDDAQIGVKESELKIKQIENERLRAQLSALTAQMNPHLLFNALNTISSLVPSDPKKAEEMIMRLSELYRGVLNASRRISHPLATELDICKSYLGVEHARFGSRLQVSIEVAPHLNLNSYQVPVLTIQPLVENAVKHGVSPRSQGGKIVILVYLENDLLKVSVEDDGVGFGNSTHVGSGTGIQNCRDRLRLTFGDEGKLDIGARPEGGTLALLSFPLLMKPVLEECPS